MSGPRRYRIAAFIFLRLLGVVYLLAFGSLFTQILGLVGHDGILPARQYMDAARAWAAAGHVGLDRFRIVPTLCWFSASDAWLEGLCIGGVMLGGLLAVGIAPLVATPLLWIAWLSLVVICREFLLYQWDALLLEAGFLAIFAAPTGWRDRLSESVNPPRPAVWLFVWLLFRLILGSGLVKLASGDPTWRSLTALTYHYETQPIPTPVAWYAHHLPYSFNKASTAATLAIELAPLFIFGGPKLRGTACGLFVALQALVALTGNYAFFNLLTVALCVFLIDDEMWRKVRLKPSFDRLGADATYRGGQADPQTVRRALVTGVAAVIFPVSALAFTSSLGLPLPGWQLVAPIYEAVAPFRSINSYGLFAVMTTTRLEIVVEGSNDGADWLPYEFRYKPGDVRRRPPWVAPHQPRLDWQMWFAALGSYEDQAWFQLFCQRLLAGSPDVLRLLARDPFQGRPPRHVRAVLYRYRLSDRETRRTTGAWWTRERIGDYSPVLSADRSQ